MSSRKDQYQEAIDRCLVNQLSPKIQEEIARGLELGVLIGSSSEGGNSGLDLDSSQQIDFTPAEVELWKRDNLSPKRYKNISPTSLEKMMVSDFLSSGLDKDSFLLNVEPEIPGPTTPSTIERIGVNVGQGIKDVLTETTKMQTYNPGFGLAASGFSTGMSGPYVGPGSGFEELGVASQEVREEARQKIKEQRDQIS